MRSCRGQFFNIFAQNQACYYLMKLVFLILLECGSLIKTTVAMSEEFPCVDRFDFISMFCFFFFNMIFLTDGNDSYKPILIKRKIGNDLSIICVYGWHLLP